MTATTPTLNLPRNLDLDPNPLLSIIRRIKPDDPEAIARLQPIPNPQELAEWIRANHLRPEVLYATSEMYERREFAVQVRQLHDHDIPGHTASILDDPSMTGWDFIVKPLLLAWLEDQENPDRTTVPERFIITGWLHHHAAEANQWSLLVPKPLGRLEPVHGTAAALPPLQPGQLYEFHTSRDHPEEPHRLWHINTLNLTPAQAGIRIVGNDLKPRYRGP